MRQKTLLLGSMMIFMGCSKNNQIDIKTPVELLTQNTWILSGYGYDHNANGVVDISENNIQDCQKDNTYAFRMNGTGSHFENAISCGNGIGEHSFAWKFIRQESAVEIGFIELEILKLNEREFSICSQMQEPGGQPVKFITEFTR